MVFLEISQNSQENICARETLETLAQVFSCEFCEISKNIFFTDHLMTTASINTFSNDQIVHIFEK